MHARRAGFDLALAAARDRLRPEPGRARPARVADGRRQVPAAGGRRASRCRSTTAAGRRSASSTSRTPRGSCSSARAAGSVANVAAETVTVADVARARARRGAGRDEPACTFATPFTYRHAPRRLPARREAARHRRDRLPRLADRRAPRGARPRGRPRLRGPAERARAGAAGRRGASTRGDPAARELLAGCDAVLHFAGVPDPAARARRPGARRARERGHDAQPARGLPRARLRARLPVDRARRRRAAARPVRALEAPRRGGLPPAPAPARRSSG